MEIINNNRKFKVYWMYNSTAIPWVLSQIGCPEQELEKVDLLPLKKQVEYMNEYVAKQEGKTVDQLENKLTADMVDVDTTHCFLMEDGKVIDNVYVRRYHKDPENRDKARKYALTKLLKKYFPEDKESRKQFWDTYMSRYPQKTEKQEASVIPMVASAPVSGL